jgi:hypothetical protein
MSANLPERRRKQPLARLYADVIHWRSVSRMPNSVWIEGRAIFKVVPPAALMARVKVTMAAIATRREIVKAGGLETT